MFKLKKNITPHHPPDAAVPKTTAFFQLRKLLIWALNFHLNNLSQKTSI